MADRRATTVRVLGIDFSSRGFGFVVVERPRFLLDWGVVRLSNREPTATLKRLADLLARYRPSALVLEDVERNARRNSRLRGLSAQATRLASQIGLPCTAVDARILRRRFSSEAGACTKYEIASLVARSLPVLRPHLPPRRKPWTSEAEAMAVFDAAAMVFYAMGDLPTENGVAE